MKISESIKSQLLCNICDNRGRLGGMQFTKAWYGRKYAKRGNHSYPIAVTYLSNENLN